MNGSIAIRRLTSRGRFAVLLVALALAGCSATGAPSVPADPSSGSSTAAEPTTAETSTTQGVTPTSIKIGIFGPFSGEVALYSKAQSMAIAVYEQVNENGGINGRMIDLVIEDSNCDTETVGGIIRKLAEQDKVFMIHGGSCSNAITAARPLIESLGIPFMTVNAASGAISDPPIRNLFQPKPTATESATGGAELVASSDVKRVAIVHETTDWGQSHYEPLMEALDATSLEIVADIQMATDAGTATPQVLQLLQAKPDVVFTYLYPQPLSVFLREAFNQGLQVPFLTGDQVRPTQVVPLVESEDMVRTLMTAYVPLKAASDPAYQSYRDLWKESNPDLEYDSQSLEGAISSTYNVELLASLGDDLTWDSWISAAETTPIEVPIVGTMQFGPFEADNPETRRPGLSVNFAMLDPNGDGDVIVNTWPDVVDVIESDLVGLNR